MLSSGLLGGLSAELAAVRAAQPLGVVGRVSALRGLTLLVDDLPLPVGALVAVGETRAGGDTEGVEPTRFGEVVGFAGDKSVVMPLSVTHGVRPGEAVRLIEETPTALVGEGLIGRVVDGLGRPIDGLGDVRLRHRRALSPPPLSAMQREPIRTPLRTGVRVLDLMTPLGRGQRLGIFAGPGVGKSTLLGQCVRGTDADVSVIALIGERGREVREFIEESLGEEGMRRAVVVTATGDEPPPMRLRAARLACCCAEFFREQGRQVLLVVDSATRFAHAQRQVGLSVGEPPATKGYTPSVFAELALLLERAGTLRSGGSVTGLYTILVEGDDMTEPVSDAARGILDGHVVLTRKLAQRGHYPAVDVLDSISRVADAVSDPAHRASRVQISRLLAAYREVEELVQIGAYASGSNPEADVAIGMLRPIEDLLTQGRTEKMPFDKARELMVKIAMQSGEELERRIRGGGR